MTRLLGPLDHDECAPWCDHDPENHTVGCDNSFCDGYECWETAGIDRPKKFDIRNEPSITITDLYHVKSGRHLRSTMSTEDGTIIEESGRCPSKDVVFFPAHKMEMWNRRWEAE